METQKRKNSTHQSLMNFILIISILSYENYIYQNLYEIFILLIFACGSLFVIISTNKDASTRVTISRIIRNNVLVHLLSVILLLMTLLASFNVGFITFASLVGVLILIMSIYIFYLFIPAIGYYTVINSMQMFASLITLMSIIGIIIGLTGSFLGYGLLHSRSASIFFDSNYYGVLCGISIILYSSKTGIWFKLFALINFVALYFTGSRASMISVLFVLLFFHYYNNKVNIKRILLFLIFSIISYLLVTYLYETGFFRIEQGTTQRELLWETAINYIAKEPWWGYGYGRISRIFSDSGIGAASSHNFFLDYTLMHGIPAVLLCIIIILLSLFRGLVGKLSPQLMKCLLFLIINSNSIFINLGGLGITSLLFTLFLGLSNCSRIDGQVNASIMKNSGT